MDIKQVAKVCRDYRIDVLGLSLTNFAKLNDDNIQNIHAFEQGRANNIKYIYMYMTQSNSYQLEVLFNSLFYDVIKGGYNDGKISK